MASRAFLKPEGCKGCPFYAKSKYITPDAFIPDAEILILAQAPGEHEEQGRAIKGYDYYGGKRVEQVEHVRPQPLIGAAGNKLREEFWPLTKVPYNTVSRGNVIKCRPYGKNDLPNIAGNKPVNDITVKELKAAVAHCTNHYLRIPASVKHVLVMGEIALYALTGEQLLNYKKHSEDEHKKSSITEWRGWVLGYHKETKKLYGLTDYYHPLDYNRNSFCSLFSVIHVAALYKNPRLYHATLSDFQRFGKLVRGEWPKKIPEVRINVLPESIPVIIGFDTEYTKANILTMWSLADSKHNIYVVDAEHSSKLVNLPDKLALITQNGLVDLPHLLPILPENYLPHITIHDCMLAYAVLWTGERTGLDYQLSIVGDYNRHKHLRETDDFYTKCFYAGLDAETTLNSAWKAICVGFAKDKLSLNEYLKRRQPLLYVINRFQERGVLTDQERILRVDSLLKARIETIQQRAKQITGNPDFNIRSNDQIKAALYEGKFSIEKKKVVKKREKKLTNCKPAFQELLLSIEKIYKAELEKRLEND